MRKNLLGLLLLWCAHISMAQTSWQPIINNDTKKNTIKLNPINPFFGQYQFAYERLLTDKIAMQLEGGFISRSQTEFDYANTMTKRGFIALPAVRYYLYRQSDDEPMFYFSAYYRYRQLNSRYEDKEYNQYSHSYTRIFNGGGLLIGGQYYMFNLISLELFAGLQYGKVSEVYRFDTPGTTVDDFELQFPLSELSGRFYSGYYNFPIRTGIILGLVF